ncbi:MAG: ABC transporter permease [Candidatus Doudnabacteria bacterium]|nr:ABC transporter permease [Candidatus Doudnabacteria bacterium]
MIKAFRLAIKSLFSNPVRTGLTTMGIIIGIGTVVLVLSAGEGFRSLVNSQVEAFGSNSIFIETRVPPTTRNRNSSVATADSSRALSSVAITTLKTRDVNDIKRLPNINDAYGMAIGQKVVSFQNVAKNVLIFGADAARFNIDKGKLKEGRFYSAAEDSGASQVVILGSDLAVDLFGQNDPVGKIIRVGELNFEVTGVYERKGSLSGMNEDQSVLMPLNTAQKKLLGIDYLIVVIAQAKDRNLAEATAEDIKIIVRKNHQITDPAKDDFFAQTAAEGLATFDTIFKGITFLLIAIAAISLLVGGVGIMNIMYVVVTERTSEIGLKKALGAHQRDILYEFLIEAVLITLLGGAVGVAGGAFLGWLVSLIAKASGLEWSFVVPTYAILLGLGVAGGIGLIFGVLPARSASKLDPVEAMRYE